MLTVQSSNQGEVKSLEQQYSYDNTNSAFSIPINRLSQLQHIIQQSFCQLCNGKNCALIGKVKTLVQEFSNLRISLDLVRQIIDVIQRKESHVQKAKEQFLKMDEILIGERLFRSQYQLAADQQADLTDNNFYLFAKALEGNGPVQTQEMYDFSTTHFSSKSSGMEAPRLINQYSFSQISLKDILQQNKFSQLRSSLQNNDSSTTQSKRQPILKISKLQHQLQSKLQIQLQRQIQLNNLAKQKKNNQLFRQNNLESLTKKNSGNYLGSTFAFMSRQNMQVNIQDSQSQCETQLGNITHCLKQKQSNALRTTTQQPELHENRKKWLEATPETNNTCTVKLQKDKDFLSKHHVPQSDVFSAKKQTQNVFHWIKGESIKQNKKERAVQSQKFIENFTRKGKKALPSDMLLLNESIGKLVKAEQKRDKQKQLLEQQQNAEKMLSVKSAQYSRGIKTVLVKRKIRERGQRQRGRRNPAVQN